MDYDLYLRYDDVNLGLNINNDTHEMSDHIFADIMIETEPESNWPCIGFIQLLRYNQALAMTYGVNMRYDFLMSTHIGSKALMELDYTRITPETIDEIGAPYNPNILVLVRFAISAAWRNKGIGEQVLKGVMKKMKGKYGYMIIINPKPAQFEEDEVCKELYDEHRIEMTGLEQDPEKAQLKLNAFFQRCGFRLFKNFENIFICNIERAVPMRKLT
jgi:GNAT superfamily N-acetyltransferase